MEKELANMEISPQGYSTPSVNKSQLTPAPPLSALKKKFLSLDNEEPVNGLDEELETFIIPEENDIEVVVVQKKSAENDTPGNGEKRTIIGSNSKGLLGTQG